jgi:hypothetical protein
VPEYAITPDALGQEATDRLESELSRSPFVGESPLSGTFLTSRGFSVVFTRAGEGELRARFPSLAPYLELALSPRCRRSLVSVRERLLGKSGPREPNAFYLNLLVLGPGDEVGAHIDATLQDLSQSEDLPELVSVLYLRCPPPDAGGRLRLWRGAAHVVDVEPARGALLCFDGELTHAVLPFVSDDASHERVSLVCEQYTLCAAALARVPAFRLHSKAGFGGYLKGPARE